MAKGRRERPQRLAAKLLAIRQHLGISQVKMAKLLKPDLAYHRLSEWESGRRMPDVMLLLQYARAAGVPVDNLIDDTLDLPF
jgi:transcriptional regulator with XRE-family HTH domain